MYTLIRCRFCEAHQSDHFFTPILSNSATMRPDCVSTRFEHVTYIETQMDDLTDEMTE